MALQTLSANVSAYAILDTEVNFATLLPQMVRRRPVTNLCAKSLILLRSIRSWDTVWSDVDS
jgi:hypothetical protein